MSLTDTQPQGSAPSLRTAVFLVAEVMAVLANAACSSTDEGTVEVEVRVSVCPEGSDSCPLLRVPDADVAVETEAGRVLASDKTDEAGNASFKVDQFGTLQVVARSRRLEHGEATMTAPLAPGGAATVSFGVPLTPVDAG
jgi:hypothetical protein